MAAAAQAGRGWSQEGGGVGRAGSSLPDAATTSWGGGAACLGSRSTNSTHSHPLPTPQISFPLVFSGPDCWWECAPLFGALVRGARRPLDKDLWSLTSQRSAWKQCQVARRFGNGVVQSQSQPHARSRECGFPRPGEGTFALLDAHDRFGGDRPSGPGETEVQGGAKSAKSPPLDSYLLLRG